MSSEVETVKINNGLKEISVFWVRQDLRVLDNPALTQALKSKNVVVLYILDDESAAEFKMGSASRWWLHHSLESFNQSIGGQLTLARGNAQTVLMEICQRFDICEVNWNRCYQPWRISRDTNIKQQLKTLNITVNSHHADLLCEPWQITKKDGTPYKIFTPYWNQLKEQEIRRPLTGAKLSGVVQLPNSISLDELELLSRQPWEDNFSQLWQPSEQGAHAALESFLEIGLIDYTVARDQPGVETLSKLAAHLHFGEISVITVWNQIKQHSINQDADQAEAFLRQLGWRDFSAYLLYHWPTITHKSLKPRYDAFPWLNEVKNLTCWQQGMTGYPLVDAGMRELWQTGYMHNRVRMIVASFLIKNLMIDWRKGAQWFWDCLLDADLANNSASWQWVAGSGTDASPFFRIFNPITQGEKFDPQGEYTRKFVPELALIPDKYLFKPWTAPEQILSKAGVTLGVNYPKPIIDLKRSRARALEALKSI